MTTLNISLFEKFFLVGLFIAPLIRTFYDLQFRRKDIIRVEKEHPVVIVSIFLWGFSLLHPLIAISV
jgi:hypothetical protein